MPLLWKGNRRTVGIISPRLGEKSPISMFGRTGARHNSPSAVGIPLEWWV